MCMKSLSAAIKRLSLVGVLLLLGGCSGLIFMPMKPWVQNPARQGLAYEDVVLIHADGMRLHGWWLPAEGEAQGTVYFLHGNAQNISTHLMNVSWLPGAGYNVFLLDYRGYGLSDGEPGLPLVLEDIQLGLDWVNASGRASSKPVIVFGQSLGAAMSSVVLARAQNQGNYDCAVLEAAFTGYKDITSDVMKRSWVLWPLRPLVVPFMPEGIDPKDHVAAISKPLLLMHSIEDEVIPFSNAEVLQQRATPPFEFQALRGRHIQASRSEQVQQRMLEFFGKRCDKADIK